jgi:uncharacterized protein (DUF111 family)
VAVELTTPTGAALLAALSSGYGPMPPMRVTGQGFGAGTHEIDELPNCTQVVTGVGIDRPTGADLAEVDASRSGMHVADSDADAGQPFALLEVNVDDATGEQLAHAIGVLLEAGAYDAWLTPVIMKKGRPGSVVNVLADPARVGALRDILRDTTGTLGVRMTTGERWPAARSLESVWIDGQMIRVKVAPGRVKAEYEDVALASRRTGRPLREVAFRAEALWRATRAEPDHEPSEGIDDGGDPA